MKTKKFLSYLISDKEPEVGDIMVCIKKDNFNYGVLSKPVDCNQLGLIDKKNWKVVVQP